MDKIIVGIPRALIYYRYERLWNSFFTELGVNVKISENTTMQLFERGAQLATDETCLSYKLFLAHVESLLGECDYILLPRIATYGPQREMCTRFSSLYDSTMNIFRSSNQRFLPFNVDVLSGVNEKDAFVALGHSIGASYEISERAYMKAQEYDDSIWHSKICEQEALLAKPDLKILIVAHDYVINDQYIGAPIVQYFIKNGVQPIFAHTVDRAKALSCSVELSPMCKWQPNRELLGSVVLYRDNVDGIILISAYPCGTDSMVNELVLRRVHNKPIYNLVLDGQRSLTGIGTRLESFLDIAKSRKENCDV